MHRTIIIRYNSWLGTDWADWCFRRDYLHFVKKYNRYEKRHKNLAAHVSPCFRVKEGDLVTVGQCRPLSKTVRFNVLKINRSDEGSKQFGKF